MAKYAFQRDAFRVWLRRNFRAKFKTEDSCECPLAQFARRGCKMPEANVGRTSITFYDKKENNDVVLMTKDWQERFIAEVDSQTGPITGKEAYKILNRVTRGRIAA